MDHFFAVRHGDYDEGIGCLTRSGNRQMDSLAEQMAEISGTSSFYLLTTTSIRGLQSSDRIARKFRIASYIKDELFHSEGEVLLPKKRMIAIDRLLEHPRKTHESVAIVSHWDIIHSYGRHLREQGGAREEPPEEFADLKMGQALYYDLQSNRFEVLDGRI